jgi:uncharacterized membrane protein YeaQ/YmgE (transglycosylase-associated protein family)
VTILGWIIFGLIAGFVASKLVNDRGQGCIVDIALGIIGAVVGGYLYHLIDRTDIIAFHFNIKSFLVAIGGAVVVLLVFHAIRGPRRW